MLKKLWNDPVWSKVIAAAIVAAPAVAIGCVSGSRQWLAEHLAVAVAMACGFIFVALIVLRIAYRPGPLLPMPDTTIADAIDYIVNDSRAKLKQPAPPRIAEFGPAAGRLMIEKGVEHSDARTKLNEQIINGTLSIWGLRQMPVTHLTNQFEISIRKIEQEYWDRMQLDFLSCFRHTNTMPQTTKIPGRQQDLVWTGLMVNKQQVHRLWPRKSLWRQCKDKIRRRARITYYEPAA